MFLTSQLEPFSERDRSKWMGNVLKKIESMSINEVAIQKDHLVTCLKVGLHRYQTYLLAFSSLWCVVDEEHIARSTGGCSRQQIALKNLGPAGN